MKKTVVLITLILMIASLTLGLCSCGDKDPVVYSYDYFSEDLSQYISIADGDYKGYELTVKMTDITDAYVDEWIMYVLCEHKLDEAKNPGKTAPLTAADVLDCWARSYIIDDDGRQIELNTLSGELGESRIHSKITVGGGELAPGAESALLGVIIADYPTMEEIELKPGDAFGEDDVLYISYALVSPDGRSNYYDVRIDLSRTDLDDEFGVGFRNALLSATMPEDDGLLASFTAVGKNGRYVYENVSVNYAYPKDARCITVSGRLPHGYTNYDLACTTVYYDIFPEYFTAYDTPELTDEFIRDTLNITDETLSEYEGASNVEKYKAYMKAELIKRNEEELHAIQEEAMWYHYNDVAEALSYPEDAVLSIYNKYVDEVKLVWESYKDEYSSLDELACAYLSLESGSDWRAKLRADSEAEVKEKLIFYYIIRKENVIPSEERYKEIFDGLFDEFVVYYMDGATAEDYSSVEGYNRARAEAEAAVMEFYGEDFFRHQVYYDYALDTLLGFSVLKIEK